MTMRAAARRRRSTFVIDVLVCMAILIARATAAGGAPAEETGVMSTEGTPGLKSIDPVRYPDWFVWTDTCNVYVLRDGDAALLIDLGDGSVLDHLPEIGVKRLEWVLFTHHHREQCQGAVRLLGTGAKRAAPAAERDLFEHPTRFRKMKPALDDPFTVYGASYVRPPVEAIPLDRVFQDQDTFAWRGHSFRCVETRGNSPGGMTYFLEQDGRRLAFSGDVMLDGARMHTWFDTEWDYGFGAGLETLIDAVETVSDNKPSRLLPSHGPAIPDPAIQLQTYERKLRRLAQLYVRGYPVHTITADEQDAVSTKTVVPQVQQITPHVFKFKGPDTWCNFGIVIADSGRALVVDCGLLSREFLDEALAGMKRHLGLKQIEAMVITHMHGDHFLLGPHLRDKYGAQVWTLDRIADKCEHPERYDYAAMIQSYNAGFDSLPVDRTFRSGETVEWEGYRLTVDWMPGQTEFGCCLWGDIDGQRIAFTGDNIFGHPADPAQNGHEAVVARNSAVLEEGYIYAAEYLKRLGPDVLVGGHSFVMGRPAEFIERYRQWSYAMRDAFQSVSWDKDYRYGFDPFWVRAEPYRVKLRPGESAGLSLRVRNFRSGRQTHRIQFHTPAGLIVEPGVLEGQLAGESTHVFPIRISATAAVSTGVHLIGLDIDIDAQRRGELFDFVVNVEP